MSIHLLKPSEVAARLGIGRTATYEMLRDGTLPTVRIGTTVRTPDTALDAWIEANTEKHSEGE